MCEVAENSPFSIVLRRTLGGKILPCRARPWTLCRTAQTAALLRCMRSAVLLFVKVFRADQRNGNRPRPFNTRLPIGHLINYASIQPRGMRPRETLRFHLHQPIHLHLFICTYSAAPIQLHLFICNNSSAQALQEIFAGLVQKERFGLQKPHQEVWNVPPKKHALAARA